ncbi:replication factor C large subunit [Candidatus Pacearchaeota archaeon]|nr:replication factor C large subunit [Candidatus Pacearchaeota archaeon]
MSWTEKYRPKRFSDVKGQDEAIAKIKIFLDNFPRTKAVILHGPPGTGKTSLVYVLARETNSEIFELNASDLRNRDKLREILKPAMEQKSLFKEKKLILVDEVDGITASDWGGLPELLALILQTHYPVIITANDIWKKELAALRKKSDMIQLKEISYKTIKEILFGILKKENLVLEDKNLTKIAINAKGDLRAALNDLQAEAGIKSEMIEIAERNKEVDIFNALRMVFKGKPQEETMRIFDSVNMPIDEIILWIEENIPAEYQGEELARAFELLSRTDIFKKRIYRQQYWRFLVYENFFLSYGISSAKKNIKTGFTSYKKPNRILKIWLNNQKNEKKKSIAGKYASFVHIGEKRAMNEFPVIKNILRNPEIQKELKLSEEEIEFVERG